MMATADQKAGRGPARGLPRRAMTRRTARAVQSVRRHSFLTLQQAALQLGITSEATMRNWLQGGAFPGARQTATGEWRFDAGLVAQVAEATKRLQECSDLTPPDCDD
jgi:hypothetical protein